MVGDIRSKVLDNGRHDFLEPLRVQSYPRVQPTSAKRFISPSVSASERAASRACSWISRGILRDGSFGQHRGLSGHTSLLSLLARYRSVLPSCTVPLVPAFRPGSGRRRLSDHIESRCARRCHHPASTCRTQRYAARCPSPRPASSALERSSAPEPPTTSESPDILVSMRKSCFLKRARLVPIGRDGPTQQSCFWTPISRFRGRYCKLSDTLLVV